LLTAASACLEIKIDGATVYCYLPISTGGGPVKYFFFVGGQGYNF